MAHVWNHELNGKHVLLNFFDFLVQAVNVIAQLFHGSNLVISIFFISLQLADFFRYRVAFILHRFYALQQFPALFVESNKLIYVCFCMAVLDVFFYFICMFADKFCI